MSVYVDRPHYDLTPKRRAAAVLAGAVEASAKAWIRAVMDGVA